MSLVTEKPGQIGGYGVEKALKLFFIFGDGIKIDADRRKALLAQPFFEAALQYRTVVGCKMDTAFIINEITVQIKISVTEKNILTHILL
jgi:hypothetical protein